MTPPPKRDKSGKFLPKWAVDLQDRSRSLRSDVEALVSRTDDLKERIGTSTPLIIWNIAVLIALAIIAAKVWGYAPY
jgi:hypothetical protein